tara:strand:+ start:1090 stop:1776 length:687 start_codon:yes stop_codon:yes gene_type:complete
MKKKVLVVVSHPDDEVIGCGGTLIKHVTNGDKVKVIFTSESESAREKNKKLSKKKTLERQKIAEKVSKHLKFEKPIFLNFPNLSLTRKDVTKMNSLIKDTIYKFKPDVIYTHSPYDIHHDHRKTFDATLVAARPSKINKVCELLTFEIPSASEFSIFPNSKNFNPNIFVNIEKQMQLKKKVLMFYKNQFNEYPNILSIKSILNLSEYRGNMVNLKFAESFELIRKINY